MTFMSPELLVPQEYGREDSTPTSQADIYAFGLVIFQVGGWGCGHRLFYICFFQVLTGDIPFRGVQQLASVYSVVQGLRPVKPKNASAIGLSDSLWGFTQRCWDGKVELRPEVGEVVMHLAEAMASWDGLMPPCVQARDACYPSSNGTGRPRSSVPENSLVAKDYQRLWEGVAYAASEAEAVRALADIMVNKEGRAFALGLDRKAAELCIEVLDCVSCDLHFPPSATSDGFVRASQSTTSNPTRRVFSSSR